MRPKITINVPGVSSSGAEFTFNYESEEISVNPPEGNNVSVLDDLFKHTAQNNVNGFQLSGSRSAITSYLDGSSFCFADSGNKGFISKTINTPIEISFINVGETPNLLYIEFDTANNEYASSIVIEVMSGASAGASVSVTDNTSVTPVISIASLALQDGDIAKITFSNWSVENRSIKVTLMSPDSSLFFYGNTLVSFVCSENMMDSNLALSPGICEQYANIEIYDKKGIFKSAGLAGLLHQNEEIEISVIDDDTIDEETGEPVEISLGMWYVENWDLSATNSRIKITCRDISYRLDKIDISKTPVEDRTVDQLLNIVFSEATGFSWIYMDSETETRCKQITIPYNWYDETDLKTILNKICVLAMLRVYWNNGTFLIGRCV